MVNKSKIKYKNIAGKRYRRSTNFSTSKANAYRSAAAFRNGGGFHARVVKENNNFVVYIRPKNKGK